LINKKAWHDYDILEKIEAGIVLTGAETKSTRLGRVQLKDSFARVTDEEVFVVNLNISAYKFSRDEDYEAKKTRKLLLKKAQIKRLAGKLQQKGLSLVPLRMYEKNNRFKLELGLVRGKKEFEKREQKKRADIKREVAREVKARYRG
jgi:SsrA-binding protein